MPESQPPSQLGLELVEVAIRLLIGDSVQNVRVGSKAVWAMSASLPC